MRHPSRSSYQPKPCSLAHKFHYVFDDDFDTMKKEQADTSIRKVKAHLQEAKERVAEVTTKSLLVSSPKHQPVTSLHLYGRDIPQVLQDLSQLLPDVPTTTDGDQVQDSTVLKSK